MRNYRNISENVQPKIDLSIIKKMADAQKYAFTEGKEGFISFKLKVENGVYDISMKKDGNFSVYSASLKEAELPEVTVYGDRPSKLNGKWNTTEWGVTFIYNGSNIGDFKGDGKEINSASVGLNAIDTPIAHGILGKKDYSGFIKSVEGKWVPLISPYKPSNACINPKTLQEILDGKCLLVRGSKCPSVGLVQSMLNLIRPKFQSAGDKWPMEIEVDNSYGRITYDSIKEFQKIQKFKPGIKVDGIVGKNTLQALNMSKEETEKKETQSAEVEIEKVEIEKVRIPKEELVKIEQLPPIELQTEIQKTLKEIRLEKKDSRKKKRLLARLERLKEREEKIKDKIEKIGESFNQKTKHILLFESFVAKYK
jgi:peptidoglycan hydrolase-like protein with peptidoglycan-binding domain